MLQTRKANFVIKLCAICGIREATTRDHVPPKGIFLKPRPTNLITVPACVICNNHSSYVDQQFLVDLGVHVGYQGGEGERFFTEHTLKTLSKNRKLHRNIVNKIRPVNLTTPSGIVYEKAYAGEWNSEVHIKVMERIVRGLYYHHFSEILGLRSTVKTHFFQSLSDELVRISNDWNLYSFGSGDVVYKYARATQDSKTASVWLFQFYGAHWAGGQTYSEDANNSTDAGIPTNS